MIKGFCFFRLNTILSAFEIRSLETTLLAFLNKEHSNDWVLYEAVEHSLIKLHSDKQTNGLLHDTDIIK